RRHPGGRHPQRFRPGSPRSGPGGPQSSARRWPDPSGSDRGNGGQGPQRRPEPDPRRRRAGDVRDRGDRSAPGAGQVAGDAAVSAARPGARRETLTTYIKRLEKLESIANSFEGVEKSFAIQAGREIRIIVKPDTIDDSRAQILARDIAKRIEGELSYPGQIKVTVIRETRIVEFAK